MEEKQLASTKDLVVSNHIQEKSLNKILTGIGVIIGIMTLTSAGKLFKTSRAAAAGAASRYFGKKPKTPKTPRSTRANLFKKVRKMKTPKKIPRPGGPGLGRTLLGNASRLKGPGLGRTLLGNASRLKGPGALAALTAIPELVTSKDRTRDGAGIFGRIGGGIAAGAGLGALGMNPYTVIGGGILGGILGETALEGLVDLFRGGKAKGGPITATGRYLVGEEGPELVNLSKGSHVTPNNQLGNVSNQSTPVDLTPLIQELKNATIAMKEVAINTKPIKNIAIGSAT
jgi:hypothetical protein